MFQKKTPVQHLLDLPTLKPKKPPANFKLLITMVDNSMKDKAFIGHLDNSSERLFDYENPNCR